MPLPRLAVETLHCRHCHSEQDLSRVQEQARVWHQRMSARLEAFESAA